MGLGQKKCFVDSAAEVVEISVLCINHPSYEGFFSWFILSY